jgi:DNA-binding NarL/FixJ family response regulator
MERELSAPHIAWDAPLPNESWRHLMAPPPTHLALVDPVDATQPDRSIAETATIPVLVAHRHGLALAGLCALLHGNPDITVVGEAGDAEEVIALMPRAQPAVLLMDIGLPGLDGVDVVRRIASDPALDGVRIVVLSDADVDADELVLPALRAGAAGALLDEDADATHVVGAVRAVAAGDGFLSPNVARRVIDEFAALPDTGRPSPEQLDELTPRELEVVSLVARGMTNSEIAEHLVVSPATAKTHVSRALLKVHARDRSQLVTLAYECGLVVPRALAPPVAA